MRAAKADRSMENTLAWAMERLRRKGYSIRSRVTLSVDPKLAIMGYAKKQGGGHAIVISEWALDSDMLGGLVLHELSHIYFTEQGARSHDGEILEEILEGMKEREGLRAKETEHLIESFNHLQNILVDDIVFDVMEGREREMAKRFFSEWVSDRPTGDPVLDGALICRNAFAAASLKRRGLYDEASDMHYRNRGFLSSLGGHVEGEYSWVESFLEHASPRWSEIEYRKAMEEYFERVLSIMRPSSKMDDLR